MYMHVYRKRKRPGKKTWVRNGVTRLLGKETYLRSQQSFVFFKWLKILCWRSQWASTEDKVFNRPRFGPSSPCDSLSLPGVSSKCRAKNNTWHHQVWKLSELCLSRGESMYMQGFYFPKDLPLFKWRADESYCVPSLCVRSGPVLCTQK